MIVYSAQHLHIFKLLLKIQCSVLLLYCFILACMGGWAQVRVLVSHSLAGDDGGLHFLFHGTVVDYTVLIIQ